MEGKKNWGSFRVGTNVSPHSVGIEYASALLPFWAKLISNIRKLKELAGTIFNHCASFPYDFFISAS